MTFVPVPATVQLRVQQTYLDIPIETTMYFRAGEVAFNAAAALALATAVRDAWATNMMPNLNTNCLIRQVAALDMSSATGFSVVSSLVTPVAGGRAGTPTPGNVAFVLTKRTANRGRSFRGRAYIGGLDELDTDGNNLLQSRASAILTSYNAVVTAGLGPGWQHVVVSRVANGAPRVTGVATPVAAVEVRDLRLDSQRGRLSA